MFKFAAGVLKEIIVGFFVVFIVLVLLNQIIPERPTRYTTLKSEEYLTTEDIVMDSQIGIWSFKWDTLIHSVEETLKEDLGENKVEKEKNATIPSFEDLQNNCSISPVVNGGEILTVRGMPIGEKKAYVSKIYFMCQERGGVLDRSKYRMYAVEHTFSGDHEEVYEYLKKLYTDELGKGKAFEGKFVPEGIMWGGNKSYIMLQKVDEGLPKLKTKLVYAYIGTERDIADLSEAIESE